MLPLLVAAVLTGLDSQVVVKADRSAWVYLHASDPTGDEFLRVWGSNGQATSDSGGDNGEFSYGYLGFDLKSVPTGSPRTAVLVVYNVAPPGFSPEDAKGSPLEARALRGRFDTSLGPDVAPDGPKTIFGTGHLVPSADSKAPTEIDIDLLHGPGDFKSALARAEGGSDHELFLALTSTMDPSVGEMSTIYKVHAAHVQNPRLAPTLRLGF